MSLSLTDARTRVGFLLDSAIGVRFTTTDVDAALATAQYEAMLHAVTAGANIFTKTGTVTTSSAGVGDLSTLAPLKLVNVTYVSGSTRLQVVPSRQADVVQHYQAAVPLTVTYVPRPTFPASGAANFVWGSATINLPPLDDLMCVIAASHLKATDGEQNIVLEARKLELKGTVSSLINIPGWSVMSMDSGLRAIGGRGAGFVYVMTAFDTLQLCYP